MQNVSSFENPECSNNIKPEIPMTTDAVDLLIEHHDYAIQLFEDLKDALNHRKSLSDLDKKILTECISLRQCMLTIHFPSLHSSIKVV